MRLITLAIFAMALWGAPAFADGCVSPDSDGDSINDCADNCIDVANPGQDDSDGDSCGNVCDADFDQDSLVGYSDMSALQANIGTENSAFDLTEPIGGLVTTDDFNAFSALFGSPPGPSGTTSGTVGCP